MNKQPYGLFFKAQITYLLYVPNVLWLHTPLEHVVSMPVI